MVRNIQALVVLVSSTVRQTTRLKVSSLTLSTTGPESQQAKSLYVSPFSLTVCCDIQLVAFIFAATYMWWPLYLLRHTGGGLYICCDIQVVASILAATYKWWPLYLLRHTGSGLCISCDIQVVEFIFAATYRWWPLYLLRHTGGGLYICCDVQVKASIFERNTISFSF